MKWEMNIMVGHMSEHLIWAPDSRDDLAFTMYAIENEERDSVKANIINELRSGFIYRQNSFYEFVNDLNSSFPGANKLSDKDWDDIYPYWANNY